MGRLSGTNNKREDTEVDDFDKAFEDGKIERARQAEERESLIRQQQQRKVSIAETWATNVIRAVNDALKGSNFGEPRQEAERATDGLREELTYDRNGSNFELRARAALQFAAGPGTFSPEPVHPTGFIATALDIHQATRDVQRPQRVVRGQNAKAILWVTLQRSRSGDDSRQIAESVAARGYLEFLVDEYGQTDLTGDVVKALIVVLARRLT